VDLERRALVQRLEGDSPSSVGTVPGAEDKWTAA